MTSSETLGARLRDARQRLGYSLADVAGTTGLSVSWLSRVERGQIDVSFTRLIQLVGCYDLSVAELVADVAPPGAQVVRASETRPSLTSVEGYSIALLAASRGNRMMPMLSTYRPGVERREFVTAEGEEFVYVLEGRLRLEFADGEAIVLDPGDSTYYSALVPHRLTAVGDAPARAVAVVTPPW
jgi:transcriptional regulator with XRE-family HTH domain